VEVIPTGVDLERFRPGDRREARRALGLDPDERLLLYVGRLDREKNLDFLLAACRGVGDWGIRLALIGRGTREADLRAAARRRLGGPPVTFLGGMPRDAIARYYRAADLFVFASTTETQGLAVLEAMASGLPVVAVRAGGVEDVVADGVSGLMAPEEPAAFAAAVRQLLADQGLADKLAAGGRDASLGFSAPELGRRLVDVYRRTLTRGAPR
jgi:glycosyltransferase involved in cell wall biosynthesis